MANVRDLSIDETFERRYEVEWLFDPPSSPTIPRYYVPPGGANGGPILRVTGPSGKKFVAIVAGDVETFRVMTWPNRNAFLALPCACLIDSAFPEESRALPGFDGHSVHYVFPLPTQNVVLIGHCCAIYCYDRDGMRWMHDNLFCCQDPTFDVAGNTLLLRAHKHGIDAGDAPVLKPIDLETGERRG